MAKTGKSGIVGPTWVEEPSHRGGLRRIRGRIAGLHCSLCTGSLERALRRIPGVKSVAVSLTHEQILVNYDAALARPDRIAKMVRDLGYTLQDPRKIRPFEEDERALARERGRLLVAVAASLMAVGLMASPGRPLSLLVSAAAAGAMAALTSAILSPWGPAGIARLGGVVGPGVLALLLRATGFLEEPATSRITALLALVTVFALAPHFLRMALQAVRRGVLNQHVLLEAGALAGIAGGAVGLTGILPGYPTAAFFSVSVFVVTYHTFSEWLALLVKTRSSQAVQKLLDLQPDLAHLVRDGEEEEVPVEEVRVGDLIRVRPGERVPVDGRVREGFSSLDLSLVTGEPMPMERSVGDPVVAGSINLSGSLLIEATAPASESFLARVIRHVEEARALKPGILHLVDRILLVYTPAVLGLSFLALASWLVGPAVAGGGPDPRRAVFAALSTLVMGYPCAVGIAAPLAIVRGAGEAARRGILMRTGEAFQTLRSVRVAVLDKTGTLTLGRPRVQLVEPTPGVAEEELLALAAAAEFPSEHPLARAIVAAAREPGLPIHEASEFSSVAGLGVKAKVLGREVMVGRTGFLADSGVDPDPVASRVRELEAEGLTVVLVAEGRRPLGAIALGDVVRPEAPSVVRALREEGVRTILVTGDNTGAARALARILGIEEVHAEILPGGKAELVRRLQREGARAMVVGDGHNDAPALMQADVGIAMGRGTDTAIESADVILVRDDLSLVLEALRVSRDAYTRVRRNVALAFAFNGIGVPLAATGLVHPVWAMVAMVASVTSIFLNSLGGRSRLLLEAARSVAR